MENGFKRVKLGALASENDVVLVDTSAFISLSLGHSSVKGVRSSEHIYNLTAKVEDEIRFTRFVIDNSQFGITPGVFDEIDNSLVYHPSGTRETDRAVKNLYKLFEKVRRCKRNLLSTLSEEGRVFSIDEKDVDSYSRLAWDNQDLAISRNLSATDYELLLTTLFLHKEKGLRSAMISNDFHILFCFNDVFERYGLPKTEISLATRLDFPYVRTKE